MRTTVKIDDEKGKELMQITSSPSIYKAVQTALVEYIEMKRKKQLLALRGKLDIADNWQDLRRQELQEAPMNKIIGEKPTSHSAASNSRFRPNNQGSSWHPAEATILRC